MHHQTQQNHWFALVLFVLFALLVASCGRSATTTPTTPVSQQLETSTVSMRLQWIPQYQFAGYIVAQVRGYYEEAGLDVTLNPGGPDFVPLPLVASGSDTFGSTGADTILLARQRGIPVVALATWFQTSPVGFMVHSDSGIATPHDFVGKTVGVFYGDNVETEYRALLAATEVERAQINEVPAQFNMEPFLSRRVDVWPVYVIDQPDLARQQGAEIDLILARDYGVVLMGDVLFATEEFIEQNPQATQAFVNATLRGWHDALSDLDETVTLVAEYNAQLNTQHLLFEGGETIKLVQYGSGAVCPGWNDPQVWEAEQQLLVDLEILPAALPLEDAFTNQFVATYYHSLGIDCTAE